MHFDFYFNMNLESPQSDSGFFLKKQTNKQKTFWLFAIKEQGIRLGIMDLKQTTAQQIRS